MKRINFVLIAGFVCLLLAIYQIFLLIDYGFLRAFGVYYSVTDSKYILETLYAVTILFLIANLTMGILALAFSSQSRKSNVIGLVFALIYFACKANPFIFSDLIHIQIESQISLPYTYVYTAAINAVPLVLFILGGMRHKKDVLRLPSD